MSRFQQILNEYFSFTRKERIGIITMLVIILLCLVTSYLAPYFYKSPRYDHSRFETEIAALKIRSKSATVEKDSTHFPRAAGKIAGEDKSALHVNGHQLFYFDPNTLSVEGWIKLGVREKTAITIQRYIAKGGRFLKAEDIGKIWGLRQVEVDRLLPFVQIKEKSATAEKRFQNNTSTVKFNGKPKSVSVIDINTADTTAFMALRGIGNKLANRIIAFRQRLGGFYQIEQVAETYALPDSVFQQIKDKLILNNPIVTKLNINKAGVDELKGHPYIRYALANAIVQYRLRHGNFTTLIDLKKIVLVNDAVYNKLIPYLSIE